MAAAGLLVAGTWAQQRVQKGERGDPLPAQAPDLILILAASPGPGLQNKACTHPVLTLLAPCQCIWGHSEGWFKCLMWETWKTLIGPGPVLDAVAI